MTNKIDELIEYIRKEKSILDSVDNKTSSYYKNYMAILEIALATLQANKDGLVLVPSEPNKHTMTMLQVEVDFYEDAIQARPTTPLDDLLGGLE